MASAALFLVHAITLSSSVIHCIRLKNGRSRDMQNRRLIRGTVVIDKRDSSLGYSLGLKAHDVALRANSTHERQIRSNHSLDMYQREKSKEGSTFLIVLVATIAVFTRNKESIRNSWVNDLKLDAGVFDSMWDGCTECMGFWKGLAHQAINSTIAGVRQEKVQKLVKTIAAPLTGTVDALRKTLNPALQEAEDTQRMMRQFKDEAAQAARRAEMAKNQRRQLLDLESSAPRFLITQENQSKTTLQFWPEGLEEDSEMLNEHQVGISDNGRAFRIYTGTIMAPKFKSVWAEGAGIFSGQAPLVQKFQQVFNRFCVQEDMLEKRRIEIKIEDGKKDHKEHLEILDIKEVTFTFADENPQDEIVREIQKYFGGKYWLVPDHKGQNIHVSAMFERRQRIFTMAAQRIEFLQKVLDTILRQYSTPDEESVDN